jgi:type I restriction enzyme S subunit
MELETFFKQFELLADAPNGVQKLRELILQLAVQGKLVPQDPNDEPAEVLLERIEAEKKRLLKEKKIGKSEKLAKIKVAEVPYELPHTWQWSRIGQF